MFLRANIRKKDGKLHRYWSVVESRRTADDRVMQRQVFYLGEINDSQKAAWTRAIEVFAEEGEGRQVAIFPDDRLAPELGCEVAQIRLRELSLHRPRQWSACWLALELWGQLDLDGFGRRGCPESVGNALVERAQDAGRLPPARPGQRVAVAPALVSPQCPGGSAR
jgi:hypothetical protein